MSIASEHAAPAAESARIESRDSMLAPAPRLATPPPACREHQLYGARVRIPSPPVPREPSEAVLDGYYAGKRERDIDRLHRLALRDIDRDLRAFTATKRPPRRAAQEPSAA